MIRILVADPLAEEGLKRITDMKEVQADVRPGLKEDELAGIVGDYEGMIIRSGVKITAKVLARPGKLRVIARAGVGVDNVDLEAATQAGILVMNTPDANTLSTAEQAMALMLALSRHVPKADAHIHEGKWKRNQFVGTQLAGKTLGIIGLGRVGRAVATRAYAFDMKVIAYDPFFSGQTAVDGKVTLKESIDAVFSECDYLTLHTVMSPDTKEMINARSIAKMKKGVRIINCARGGLINEADLAAALESGHVAGAAVDVFSTEPPAADNPLLKAPGTVLSPHLGASTEEAQLAVTLDAVDVLLKYLLHDEIRWAVNVSGLPPQLTDRDRGYLDLARRMGIILSRLCIGGIESVTVTTHSESAEKLARVLQKQILVDLLGPHLSERLNFINIDAAAKSRGIKTSHSSDVNPDASLDGITVVVQTRDGEHRITGEVWLDGRPRIMSIDGYKMNLEPEGDMVLIFNNDQPGVIGLVGTIFGDHKLNIADMMLSRRDKTALMVLKVDQAIPAEVLATLTARKPIILDVLPVKLPAIGK